MHNHATTPVTLDVWVDIACPWCAIGERRLGQALQRVPFGDQVDVRYRAYQLQPDAPEHTHMSQWDYRSAQGATDEYLTEVFARVGEMGAADGLEFNPRKTIYANTRTAHRLIQAAAGTGLQHALVDAIFTGFFAGTLNIGEAEELRAAAQGVGLPADLVDRVLSDPDAFAEEVDRDLALAPQLGISGVPFYVFRDKYGVSGAQSVDVLVDALTQVHGEVNQPAA